MRNVFIAAIAIAAVLLVPTGSQAFSPQAASNEQLSVSISPSGAINALAVYFVANVSGGTPPYSFQWFCNDTPVEGATASAYTFSPSFGTYSIYAMVDDSLNSSATSNATIVTVKPSLQIDLAGHNYLTYVGVGQPVFFSAVVTGGVPPYRYQWYYQLYQFGSTPTELSAIGDAVEGAASQNFTFVPASTGHYLISVRAWDSSDIEGYFMRLPPGIWVNIVGPTTSSSQSLTPIPTPTVNPSPSSTSTQSPTLTPSATMVPSSSPLIPEFPSWVILPLLTISVTIAGIYLRRRMNNR